MLDLTLSEIKKIEEVVYNDPSYISLSQGALKVGGIPQAIKDHMSVILKTDMTDYYASAWGIPELRTKLAHHLNQRYNCSLTSENIIVSHGSIGALATLFATLTQPGDHILIPEPAYPAYMTLSQASRCQAIPISMRKPTHNKSVAWQLDIEKIAAAITPSTKFLIVSNPNNPTGIVFNHEELADLAALCEQHGIYFICDEVYDDYLFDDAFASSTPLVQSSDYVIRTGSFSKNYSMSGWRVGYMVVPNHFTSMLGKMQDALLNCPNVFAQHAALYALDHPELIVPFSASIQKSFQTALSLLEPLRERGILDFARPQAGFNLFIRSNHLAAERLIKNLREQAKVTLVPGHAFGPTGHNFFRLCYARHPHIVEQGITRIVDHIEKKFATMTTNSFMYAAR